MAMSISSISSLQSMVAPTRVAGTGSTGAAGATSTGGGALDQFGNMLDQLGQAQNNADSLALKAATGDLSSVQALTMASTEAQLMTQMTVTIRNKAVEAFKDIMGMQI